MQAFGAPGFIKINAAWFSQTERGTFAGIFGCMINLSRFLLFTLGPALLAGFTFLGICHVPPLHWRWLFWVPAGLAAVVAVVLALFVKDTPEEAGFTGLFPGGDGPRRHRRPRGHPHRVLADRHQPVVWIIAMAYACTGPCGKASTNGFRATSRRSSTWTCHSAAVPVDGFLIPFVASAGSLLSGVDLGPVVPGAAGAGGGVDLFHRRRRLPRRAAQAHGTVADHPSLVMISFTVNSTHSLLGPAAAMDIGGRKMAGFASGVIDSFQYLGAGLALKLLGWLLDKNWDYYFYFMAPFGLLGGILMWTIAHRRSLKKGDHPHRRAFPPVRRVVERGALAGPDDREFAAAGPRARRESAAATAAGELQSRERWVEVDPPPAGAGDAASSSQAASLDRWPCRPLIRCLSGQGAGVSACRRRGQWLASTTTTSQSRRCSRTCAGAWPRSVSQARLRRGANRSPVPAGREPEADRIPGVVRHGETAHLEIAEPERGAGLENLPGGPVARGRPARRGRWRRWRTA